MSDEKSLNDWESVSATEHEGWVGVKASDNEDSVRGSSPNDFLVEIPQGLIPCTPYQGQEPSIGSSFVKNVNALDITKNVDDSLSINKTNDPGAATKKSPPSSSDKTSSSWSHVSNGSSNPSYVPSGWATTTSSSLGSVISNFDVISLSGRTIVRCKRCKYHNAPGTNICDCCSLALVANPNPSMDEQIAMALQQKEDQDAITALIQYESTLLSLKKENLLKQSSFLAKGITDFLRAHDSDWLHPLGELDLKLLISEVIAVITNGTENLTWSLAYTFTSGSERTWEAIRIQGFEHRNPRSSQDLFTAFHTRMPTSSVLDIIPEDSCCAGFDLGWIVLVARYNFEGETKKINRSKTLPLVGFKSNAGLSNSKAVEGLLRGLSVYINDVLPNILASDDTVPTEAASALENEARPLKKNKPNPPRSIAIIADTDTPSHMSTSEGQERVSSNDENNEEHQEFPPATDA